MQARWTPIGDLRLDTALRSGSRTGDERARPATRTPSTAPIARSDYQRRRGDQLGSKRRSSATRKASAPSRTHRPTTCATAQYAFAHRPSSKRRCQLVASAQRLVLSCVVPSAARATSASISELDRDGCSIVKETPLGSVGVQAASIPRTTCMVPLSCWTSRAESSIKATARHTLPLGPAKRSRELQWPTSVAWFTGVE
jgi:hypothetical protein